MWKPKPDGKPEQIKINSDLIILGYTLEIQVVCNAEINKITPADTEGPVY